MNLKTSIQTNNVEEYMSTIHIANFIKEYDSLDKEDMKKFIKVVNESNSKNWVNFNCNSENIPPYPKN